MKIFSVDKIKEADAYTIQNEPIADIDLMERAATQLFKWIRHRVDPEHRIFVFAGLGNNGGDGMALSRLLTEAGYEVFVYVVKYSDKSSDSFSINFNRFKTTAPERLVEIESEKEFPEIGEEDLIVDAIFGSGLTRPVKGMAAAIIRRINASLAVTLAIDIPSGLYADKSSLNTGGEIIHADYTLSFQLPKFAFLLPENDSFVGEWHILDIGLHPTFIQKTRVENFYLLKKDIRPLIKKRGRFSHKGTYGHALLIAGSYGKMGAAILSAKATLRSGVGLLHVHTPKAGYTILQTALPEAMLSMDRYENYFSEIPDLSPFNAIGIGPGLGMEHQSQMAMKLLIQNYRNPLVIDADGLNILAQNKTWLSFLPPNSILTPHPKEFERLAGKWANDFDKIEKQKAFAIRFKVIVVLKGAHTTICLPNGHCYFNSTGNPGMATAGSGDVLTGIITGLLAQHYAPEHAALLGVYLHGLAGDLAVRKTGLEALMAMDIVDSIGRAFKKIK